jgi:hypothetical protein
MAELVDATDLVKLSPIREIFIGDRFQIQGNLGNNRLS